MGLLKNLTIAGLGLTLFSAVLKLNAEPNIFDYKFGKLVFSLPFGKIDNEGIESLHKIDYYKLNPDSINPFDFAVRVLKCTNNLNGTSREYVLRVYDSKDKKMATYDVLGKIIKEEEADFNTLLSGEYISCPQESSI